MRSESRALRIPCFPFPHPTRPERTRTDRPVFLRLSTLIQLLVCNALSSSTKLVVPPSVSVSEPVNLRVTVCPA